LNIPSQAHEFYCYGFNETQVRLLYREIKLFGSDIVVLHNDTEDLCAGKCGEIDFVNVECFLVFVVLFIA
jgi:hypothetical protein